MSLHNICSEPIELLVVPPTEKFRPTDARVIAMAPGESLEIEIDLGLWLAQSDPETGRLTTKAGIESGSIWTWSCTGVTSGPPDAASSN